jgi:hypothetical protein
MTDQVVLKVVGAGDGGAAGQYDPEQAALGIVMVAGLPFEGVGFAGELAEGIVGEPGAVAEGILEGGELAGLVEGKFGARTARVGAGDELLSVTKLAAAPVERFHRRRPSRLTGIRLPRCGCGRSRVSAAAAGRTTRI